jgi:hypothetical protein
MVTERGGAMIRPGSEVVESPYREKYACCTGIFQWGWTRRRVWRLVQCKITPVLLTYKGLSEVKWAQRGTSALLV